MEQAFEHGSRLRELALRYHEECETYDRTVCTGPIVEDSIMPMTARERALVQRNSFGVFSRLAREAEAQGFTTGQFWNEIGHCS